MRDDALGAVSRSAASRYGVLTRRQAAQLGLHRNRIAPLIAAGVLSEPRPGVLVLSSVAASWEQSVAVAQMARGGHGAVSHRSAARRHALDGCNEAIIDLSSTRRVRMEGVSTHWVAALEPCDVIELDGIPTTGLARTLVDLGSVVSAARVERALDDARRRGTSLRWIEETAHRLHRPGQAGTATILALIADIRPDEAVRGSWFEKLVELMLDDVRIPAIARQHVVEDGSGTFVAQVDLAIPCLQLAIEAHSREFHFGRQAKGSDEDRDHRLARVGWDTTYLGFQSTRRPAATLKLVVDIVDQRRQLLGRGLA